ncbi:hypothetical protein CLOP_g20208 [Closterium sp. NIES-67]|nr:hypothetical protein CLOP_g20208 [Closterium sp. NIES-67]
MECNLGETSKACEPKESGAAAKGGGNEEEKPKISKAAEAKEKGESLWGTIASAAFSNPTSATGECDWLTLHRRMGHVALPILQQIVKQEMGPNGKEWKKASDEEMGSIIENNTFDLVNLPPGRKAISSKWLFKRKTDADGNIERYKSRLPEGYNDGSGRVWKLKKALYGLKQAPRQWYVKLREVLEAISFTPSTADQSLFMLGEGEQRSFMVVYVDDILIFSPSSDLVKEVMLKLQDKFKCKTLGDVNYYLGLHIERDVEKR